MPKRPLAVLLVGAAFLIAAAAPGGPAPPLCRVERFAVPGALPGFYTVVVRTVPDCPPDGHAYVRLESGRVYPWREITPGQRVTYKGVPWYWRGAWRAASGIVYRFEIPGMHAPWGGR